MHFGLVVEVHSTIVVLPGPQTAPQGAHSMLPSISANFPVAHSEQAEEATPENFPREQIRHSVCSALVNFPESHVKHVAEPGSEL